MANSETPRPAFVAFLTITEDDDDRPEILLNFGPGDHTCERWRVDEDQLKLIVAEGVRWLLER